MKTTFKIARTELAMLFYSPIAWFLLVAFLFQAGLAYTNAIENFLTQQQMGGAYVKYIKFITANVYGPPYGIWSSLSNKLYLYLPLLTMGLMSREISSGTIKLLYSSPTKIREIIFGKFICMMMYNLFLIGILGIIVICGVNNIQNADAGMLLTGLLGMYLLLCTYAAIGLFMSSLTSYQVVAALCTLVVLAALSYVGQIWQDIDFVRDLTYFLSISGRADTMLAGLITTKDVFYFVAIITMFLSFCIYKLQSDRESKPTLVKVGRYALIVVCVLALGYLTSRPRFTGYYDATTTKTMTLTASGQEIMRQTGDTTLEVTSYINLLDNFFWYGRPDQRNADMSRWEQYLRFKPDIKFKYVYYYDSVADKNFYKFNPGQSIDSLAVKYAKSMKINMSLFKTPAEIRKMVDLSGEQGRYVMQLKYKDKMTFLRLFNDQLVFPTETETGAAIKRLQQANLPKIAFVTGELERSIDKAGDRHYKVLTNDITFRYSLINQGFDVMSLSLKEQDIPADITALVIADPKVSFDTVALSKIKAYIAAGGNLLVAGEPGKQEILNPVLKELGVQLKEGMLVEPNKDFSPSLIKPLLSSKAAGFTRKLQDDKDDSLVTTMFGAAALTYDTHSGFAVDTLLATVAGGGWNKKIKPTEDMIQAAEDATGDPSSGGATVMIASAGGPSATAMPENDGKPKENGAWKGLSFSPEQGDEKGSMVVALGLSRTVNGKQQRIVVSGDADFLSNSELGRSNIQNSNFDFSTGVFSWFANGKFPIDSYRPPSKDRRLTLTDGSFYFLKVMLMGVLPGILVIIGAVVLIRRKRK
ncbi:Gldg family protein [Flavitalea sp. BT771]|uniref:Gldg family protein n=1 Tax=Flavitalea sp. BT771 TaxID=3063329 RepID=UPI0026E3E6D3|nr:Gldg family protein [Flavitalea sp. BT771]MDO6429389.1 Gldg family protein [Flavitalea sp. BT771]MDV6218483.1 Gldg family protein [Flavitalea sp. BT771]